MIDSLQMLTVIKDTLTKMGSKYASQDAQMLVFRTGLVESKYKYIMQKGGNNIARGFWQCEPWVAVSLCNDYLKYRKELLKRVAEICHLDWSYFTSPDEDKWREVLTTNLIAGIVVCRLHYWRVPKKMPTYKKDDAPIGLSETSLFTVMPKCSIFVKDHPKANGLKEKRVKELLTQILESMHPDESLVFIQMLKKKLKCKGLTEKLVLEVFPDLYRKVEK